MIGAFSRAEDADYHGGYEDFDLLVVFRMSGLSYCLGVVV